MRMECENDLSLVEVDASCPPGVRVVGLCRGIIQWALPDHLWTDSRTVLARSVSAAPQRLRLLLRACYLPSLH